MAGPQLPQKKVALMGSLPILRGRVWKSPIPKDAMVTVWGILDATEAIFSTAAAQYSRLFKVFKN